MGGAVDIDGELVGISVGIPEGTNDGESLATIVGDSVTRMVGTADGASDGVIVGFSLVIIVGVVDGLLLGLVDGTKLGVSLGRLVDGSELLSIVGTTVGGVVCVCVCCIVGDWLGISLDSIVGVEEADIEGVKVGLVGELEGKTVGTAVGSDMVGDVVGTIVGDGVGTTVSNLTSLIPTTLESPGSAFVPSPIIDVYTNLSSDRTNGIVASNSGVGVVIPLWILRRCSTGISSHLTVCSYVTTAVTGPACRTFVTVMSVTKCRNVFPSYKPLILDVINASMYSSKTT